METIDDLSDFSGMPKELKRLIPKNVPRMARIKKLYDGDTFTVVIDDLDEKTSRMRIRIKNLWCEEIGTPAGDAAAEFIKSLLSLGSYVLVMPHEKSRDRRVSNVWILINNKPADFAAHVIAAGHGKDKPTPQQLRAFVQKEEQIALQMATV